MFYPKVLLDLNGFHSHLLGRLQVPSDVIEKDGLTGSHAKPLQGDVKDRLVGLSQLLNTRLNHL